MNEAKKESAGFSLLILCCGGWLAGFGRGHDLFKQQSCAEPAGREVQADEPIDVPATLSVIPGTEFVAGEEAAGEVFRGEDHAHVGQPTKPGGEFFQEPAQEAEEGAAAVNGEHPDGGDALQREIPAAQGADGREEDFQAPACQPAFQVIFNK